jgi:shikimate dehydrogenase
LYQCHFEKGGIDQWARYLLTPVKDMGEWAERADAMQNLMGFNVTTPHKESILRLIDIVVGDAKRVKAVNTVVVSDNLWIGYNTDVLGFRKSFVQYNKGSGRALILGSGGAARAVRVALQDLKWDVKMVSRRMGRADFTYKTLAEEDIGSYDLIVQATPLGAGALKDKKPKINYDQLRSEQLLFDLNYYPEKSIFLVEGMKRGCVVVNGSEMLKYQAEKAWDIWTQYHPYLIN